MTSPFRPDCLSGKIALVTGGGSGICFEVTKQLLLHGAKGAVICGRRENFLKRSSTILERDTGKSCTYKVCDVRDPDACIEAVDYAIHKYGRLDILVNGAAGNFLAEAKSLSPKGFATVMGIDALGTFNMCSAAFSKMAKQRDDDSIIINISATLQSPATHWVSHASAAKGNSSRDKLKLITPFYLPFKLVVLSIASIDSLTRSLALEWGPENIRVVGIAPGPIADTPGTTKLAPGLDSEDINNMITDGIPLGRMGEASEIGQTAVFLCTAKYITGDVVIVDGGEWLFKPPMVPKELVSELSRKVEAKSRAQAPQSRL
jgi:peroxisomal 2,4-dienoyl-CoA reductase